MREEAIDCLQQVLEEIEAVFGKNKDYFTAQEILKNFAESKEGFMGKGMELAKGYYLEFGRPMLEEKIPGLCLADCLRFCRGRLRCLWF